MVDIEVQQYVFLAAADSSCTGVVVAAVAMKHGQDWRVYKPLPPVVGKQAKMKRMLEVEEEEYVAALRKALQELKQKKAQLKQVPVSVCTVYSTSTPPVPFSSTDLLSSYSKDPNLRHHNHHLHHHHHHQHHHHHLPPDELRRNSQLSDLGDRDRLRSGHDGRQDGQDSREFMENSNSRSGSRKGTMSDRGSPEKDADDRPPSIAGPRDRAQLPIKPNYFKPNGLRMSVINPRLSGSSRDSEDLVATGTNWMPLPSEKPRTTRSGQSVNNGISNGSSQVAGPFPPKRTNSRSTANQGSSTQYSGSNRKSKDTEPKYPDPMVGATTASFQTRIAELNALEVETIRWEKSRKFKKKPKQDS